MSEPTEERNALVRTLDSQRRRIIESVEALNGDEPRTATLPSGWTPLGLLRHLTLADERYWFDGIVGGQPLDWFPEGPRADWIVDASESVSEVISAYRRQVDVSNGWIECTEIDAPPRQKDPAWAEWGIDFADLRTVMLHMIVETATHAGHLDAAVELIDGRQYLVMD